MSGNSETKIRPAAAGLAIGALIIYQVLLFGLIFIRPDLDPYWHTVSEWAIGPWGWLMSAAFIIAGVGYGALFVAIRSQIRGWWGYIGLAILAICAVGLIGVGTFTMDPMTTPPDQFTPRGIAHIAFGMIQLMLLPFAALIINLNIGLRNQEWAGARKILLVTAFVPLAGLVGFIVHLSLYIIPLGETAYGPDVPVGWPPRFLFLTYFIWLVTLAWQALKVKKGLGSRVSDAGLHPA